MTNDIIVNGIGKKYLIILIIIGCTLPVVTAYFFLEPMIEKGNSISNEWASRLKTSTDCDQLKSSLLWSKNNMFGHNVVVIANERIKVLGCP